MQSTLRWGNPPPGIHNAPIYLGRKTGSFTLPGVQIESRDNLTGADYTQELLAGSYDMGHIGTPPLFAALAGSQEYTIIGQGLVKYPPFYVMAPATTRSLRELAGQVVSLNKLRTCPHSIIRTLLRWEGMAEDQIQLMSLVEGEAIVESIRRGDSAAAVLWEPYVSYAERVFGWQILAEGRTVMLPSNYGILVYARRSLLAAQPELVQDVLAAYARSVRAAQTDLAETIAAVQAHMPQVPPQDVAAGVRREAQYWTADPRLDPGLLDTVMTELRVQTVVPEHFMLSDYVAELPLAA